MNRNNFPQTLVNKGFAGFFEIYDRSQIFPVVEIFDCGQFLLIADAKQRGLLIVSKINQKLKKQKN
ncbi:MAG TPA: hypothetical protein DEO87_01615 [Lachnospiraceae bacterium]|nr:hypothetical protein [Lachnospiraceae bacterium]